MNKNEIKKALYREKPTGRVFHSDKSVKSYKTTLKDGTTVFFNVPLSDMGDAKFEDEMEAHLLIRWIS